MTRKTSLSGILAAALIGSVATAGNLTIDQGELQRNGQPFFPIGFVRGTTPQDLTKAAAVGMNSVQGEYSMNTLWAKKPGQPDPAGLEQIKTMHANAAAQQMTMFALLTGHYVPKWLAPNAGPHPVNADGKKIGLWFPHSIHNPQYRQALEDFWKTVMTAVGADPNAVFISWNEPGYGLDYTPDARAAFRKTMQQRYPSIAAFNQAMGTAFADFAAIIPPPRPEPNRRYWYAWVEYNQQAYADFFRHQRELIKKIAPGALLTGKHPVTALSGETRLLNDIVLQTAVQDIPGCDMYNGSLTHYRDIMEIMRSLNPRGPVISYETHPQKGIGSLNPDMAALQMFVQIIGGCRGLFFYCFNQDKKFGFFTDEALAPAARAKLTNLFQLINTNQAAFAAPRDPAPIAVLVSTPSTVHYGFAATEPECDRYTKRLAETYDLLRNQHFAVDFIADRQLADKLSRYRLLVIPSLSILSAADLATVAAFHRNGGKLLVFGGALANDEYFNPIAVPAFLGIKKREPAPWSRDHMRLIEVAPALTPDFPGELTVQHPERVNPLPMEQAIPGYIPQTSLKEHIWLAANQDAYPSIIQSNDQQIVYCAFDSIYGEGLSRLLGGIVSRQLGIPRELSARRDGEAAEAPEVMTAVNGKGRVIMLANAGPLAGVFQFRLNTDTDATYKSIVTGQTVRTTRGVFKLPLAAYGYDVLIKTP